MLLGVGLTAGVAAIALAGAQYSSVLAQRGPIAGAVSQVALMAPAAAPASFAKLAKRLTPTVVYVEAVHRLSAKVGMRSRSGSVPPSAKDGPFGEFFGRFFGPQGQRQMPGQRSGPRAKVAAGSGFVIDPSGYIVTNNHVISGADKVTVRTNDGKRYIAKIVGRDAKTDLALLKIKGDKPFASSTWGDSRAAQIGDWILAIGNPFGLGGTVTAGIISARGRDIRSGPYDNYLQIDAPINSGNSGGPLFNTNGDVIGINTAIYTPNGGNVGIGFAIPSNLAKPIIAQLRAHGAVTRGWLGVEVQAITPEIAKGLGQPKPEGALVAKVVPGSPAAKAGLKQGDVIRRFADSPVTKLRDLPMIVARSKPGSSYEIELWRNGRTRTVKTILSKQPVKQVVAQTQRGTPGEVELTSTGMTLAALTPRSRSRFGIPASTAGVLVTDVSAEGGAFEAGVRPGDVIEKIGDRTVSSPEDVAAIIREAGSNKRSAVLLLLSRGGAERFVGLPTPTA